MINVKHIVLGALANNCYLLTDEKSGESALIDCTKANDRMFGFIGDAKLKYILLTHGHFDHIGGVAQVKEKYGAKVVIGKQDEGMLSSGKLSLASFAASHHNTAKADITVEDGDTLTLGETVITVMATPGHTKGGVCYIADGVIFTGDTLFCGDCGRTDFPGGSDTEMKQSLKRLASLDKNYTVYPGHDEFTTLDMEKRYNPYME